MLKMFDGESRGSTKKEVLETGMFSKIWNNIYDDYTDDDVRVSDDADDENDDHHYHHDSL